MPISGLVVTLSSDGSDRSDALEWVRADERMTVGDAVGNVLPVVTETDTMDEHEELWNELAALSGVLQVRLAYHDFSDVQTFRSPPAPARIGQRNGG